MHGLVQRSWLESSASRRWSIWHAYGLSSALWEHRNGQLQPCQWSWSSTQWIAVFDWQRKQPESACGTRQPQPAIWTIAEGAAIWTCKHHSRISRKHTGMYHPPTSLAMVHISTYRHDECCHAWDNCIAFMFWVGNVTSTCPWYTIAWIAQ